MLNILKKDNKIESFDFKKVNHFLSWAKEEENSSIWSKIKTKWKNFWKIKNKENPFALKGKKINTVCFSEVLDGILNTTPEQEKAYQQRVYRMLNYMTNPYVEKQIEENIYIYINKIKDKEDDYYYKVHDVQMTPEEYQHFLEKRELNKKLNKELSHKKQEKRIKL